MHLLLHCVHNVLQYTMYNACSMFIFDCTERIVIFDLMIVIIMSFWLFILYENGRELKSKIKWKRKKRKNKYKIIQKQQPSRNHQMKQTHNKPNITHVTYKKTECTMHIYRSFVHVQCSMFNERIEYYFIITWSMRSYQPKKREKYCTYIRNQKLTNQIEHGAYVLCQRLTEKRRETWIEMIKLDCHCHRVHWWRRQLWRQILVNVLIIIVAVYLHALHLEMFCWMCALKIEIHPILMHCNASIHNEKKKKSTRHGIMKGINLKRYRIMRLYNHSNFIRKLFCSRKKRLINAFNH